MTNQFESLCQLIRRPDHAFYCYVITSSTYHLFRTTPGDERLLGFALRDYFWFLVSHFWLLSEAFASLLFFHFNRHRHPPSGFGKRFHPLRSFFLSGLLTHSGKEFGSFPYTIFTFPLSRNSHVSTASSLSLVSCKPFLAPFQSTHLFVVLHLHLGFTKHDFHGFSC